MTSPHAPPTAIEIGALRPGTIATLTRVMERMDPWHRLGITASRLVAALTDPRRDVINLEARIGNHPDGLLSMRLDWLFGPYIRLLAVRPEAQGRGVGAALIAHVSAIAQTRGDANIWVCASAFNSEALRFYAREGFEQIGVLEQLVVDTEDEVLLRRRLATTA